MEFSLRFGPLGGLLGRAWFVYEIGFPCAVLLILAVIGSAAGTFLLETFGLPYAVGVIGLLAAIGFLVFKGTGTIERFFSGWSFLLYGAYIVFFAWSIARFGDGIGAALASGEVRGGWALSGFRYGVLQLSLVPAMLFATRHIRRRREALWAGALTGPVAMIPGILFLVAMASQYPDILQRPVPANHLLELLGSRVPDRVPAIRNHRSHRHRIRRPELGVSLHLRAAAADHRDVQAAPGRSRGARRIRLGRTRASVGRNRVGVPILKG